MARKEINISMTMTETAHFRRLVMFLEGVERHANDRDDEDLGELVRDVRADLAALSSKDE